MMSGALESLKKSTEELAEARLRQGRVQGIGKVLQAVCEANVLTPLLLAIFDRLIDEEWGK